MLPQSSNSSKAPFTDTEIQALIKGVRQAGAALMHYWPGKQGSSDLGAVEWKGDGSPVSAADLQSNQILCGLLKELYPNDAILSEELPVEPAVLKASSRVWIVDPLDGTSAFLQGRDDFSILLSLWSDGQPALGVMFFPARDRMVIAQKGQGAFLNGTRMSVSDSFECNPGGAYIRNFECSKPQLASPMMDSGLALMKVAYGDLQGAVIKMTTHREWDLAAPIVAILEAGGQVSDELGGTVLCGTGEILFSYFVASNRYCHKTLLGLIPR
jgi:myo-inositol-1(or 4)-monophosphatase